MQDRESRSWRTVSIISFEEYEKLKLNKKIEKCGLVEGYVENDVLYLPRYCAVPALQIPDGSEYPQDKSPSDCWYDGHSFQGRPYPIAFQLIKDRKSKRFIYKVYSFCCSPNCALAFALKDGSFANKQKRIELTKKMYKEYYNLSHVIPALPWQRLQKYGGELSIDEFRKESTLGMFTEHLVKLPFIVYNPVMEQRVHSNMVKTRHQLISQQNKEKTIEEVYKESHFRKEEDPYPEALLSTTTTTAKHGGKSDSRKSKESRKADRMDSSSEKTYNLKRMKPHPRETFSVKKYI